MTYTPRDIAGLVAVITGATSGIGKETARLLVSLGCKVVINARGKDRLEELVQELGSDNTAYVAGDCADPAVARQISHLALEKFGKIDIVIPNAGIGMYGSILDYSDDQISQMLRTNIDSTIHIIRAALPVMIESGFGDIVIVASVAGFQSAANQAVYSGTKHAQVGIAAALDREPSGKRSKSCPSLSSRCCHGICNGNWQNSWYGKVSNLSKARGCCPSNCSHFAAAKNCSNIYLDTLVNESTILKVN